MSLEIFLKYSLASRDDAALVFLRSGESNARSGFLKFGLHAFPMGAKLALDLRSYFEQPVQPLNFPNILEIRPRVEEQAENAFSLISLVYAEGKKI